MLASFGQEDENSRNDLASKLAMLIKTGRLQARLDLVEMVSCLETADWAHDG